MEFILIIVGLAIFWFVFKNRKQNDDSHLSETQKRWRAQNNSYQTSETNKTSQMNEYIIRHKKPFRVLEWLLTPVDPRLAASYIFNVVLLLLMIVSGWYFFEFPIYSDMLLICVLIMDFLSYNKQLLCEVTIWNPEFQEKFMK